MTHDEITDEINSKMLSLGAIDLYLSLNKLSFLRRNSDEIKERDAQKLAYETEKSKLLNEIDDLKALENYIDPTKTS
jgi:hypothetical protein